MFKKFNREKELQKQKKQYEKCFKELQNKIKENPNYKIVYHSKMEFTI